VVVEVVIILQLHQQVVVQAVEVTVQLRQEGHKVLQELQVKETLVVVMLQVITTLAVAVVVKALLEVILLVDLQLVWVA
jgi:hypothetical protein